MTKEYTTDWFSNNGRPRIWKELFGHLAGWRGLRVLEAGSYEGRSAVWFMENLVTHPAACLVCIDAWKGGFNDEHPQARMDAVEARFDKNVMHSDFDGTVVKVKQDSAEGLASILAQGQKFDIVYVDACHRPAAATADIVLAKRLLRPGGYLIIDDYSSKHPNHVGLTEAVDRWLLENTEMEVVHKGYQMIVQKPRPPLPIFYCQVYQDPERLVWCLGNLRRHYPDAQIYIISDGFGKTSYDVWQGICKKFRCMYFDKSRIKLLHYGGQMLQRNLSIFIDQCEEWGTHLVKFDTDTWFRRPLKVWPTVDGAHGTVQYNSSVPDRLRSLQGGCLIWTRAAVTKLLESKVLLNSKWADPATWHGDRGQTADYVARTGLISEDWLLGQACLEADVPMIQFDEVYSLWVGEIDNTDLHWAVTHPHKNCPN